MEKSSYYYTEISILIVITVEIEIIVEYVINEDVNIMGKWGIGDRDIYDEAGRVSITR